MSENAKHTTRTLATLAATIVVAGALVAGLLLPWIGGTGLVARNSASLLDALPVELTNATPAGNTRVLAADGTPITNFFATNRTPVTSDQISDVMKQALVDIEDSRFYEHNGVDVQGTLRALLTNVAAGSVREGGSTLTQQLVKQTLLQTATTPEEAAAADEESVARKLREARLALALEETYSKDEILTRYLNIVYFGNGAYGIQAAAQAYFSVNAVDLTLAQASMLAGLVQSPAVDDPIKNPENAQVRRNQVLQRMLDLGHATQAEFDEISVQPVQVAPGQPPANGCIDAAIGGFFCAFLLDYLTGELGLTQDQIDNGGLTIQTTLRPDMQAAGDQAVLNTLPMGDPLAGMYTALNPSTGAVLAMSVNRRYGCPDPDCESVVLNDAYSQGAGSTYKTFVAAAALERGFSQHYTLTTPEPYVSRVYRNGTDPYDVENVGNNYPATLDLEQALVMSSNTYFLALSDALGSIEAPVRMAEAMGMNFISPSGDQIVQENHGAFSFGPYPTSPLDLASAYGTLAANGTQCDPSPVKEILDRHGQPLTDADGEPVVLSADQRCTPEAIPPGVATTLNQILRKDVEPGHRGQTGGRAYIEGHQIAGKTGTSQMNFSIAFAGYTPQYAASVMVLNPKRNQDVGGFGGGKGATIWHDAMVPILTGQPMVPFPPADPRVQEGNTRFVPGCGGLDDCQRTLEAAGFRPVVVEVDSDRPAGYVVGTSPSAGSRAVIGQDIAIQLSNGSAYVEPAPEPPPAPTEPEDGDGGDDGDGDGDGGDGGDGGGDGGDGGDAGDGGGDQAADGD